MPPTPTKPKKIQPSDARQLVRDALTDAGFSVEESEQMLALASSTERLPSRDEMATAFAAGRIGGQSLRTQIDATVLNNIAADAYLLADKMLWVRNLKLQS